MTMTRIITRRMIRNHRQNHHHLLLRPLLLLVLLLLFKGTFVLGKKTTTTTTTSTKSAHTAPSSTTLSRRPNFVIVLTDDLDISLGGMEASTLQKTRQLLGGYGMTIQDWFVQTPVCCPSRAELLTGKFFHNLKVPNRTDSDGKIVGCMHINVQDNLNHPFYDQYYFAQYFQQLNYTVGIFGKHLNNENPTSFLPKGIDEMLINYGGTYFDPTFTVGTRQPQQEDTSSPQSVTFDNCTNTTGMPCYSTSIIGNASLAWIQRWHAQHHHRNKNNDNNDSADDDDNQTNIKNDDDDHSPKPFFALISLKAPHLLDGPGFPMAIPAPWYTETIIPESVAPRTKTYNISVPDHHWLVRNQYPLTDFEEMKIDELYISRLKTLLSVDDLVEDIINTLEDLSILSNTYIIFTSDNGYRLGQFRMPQGKLHTYENDIRVPMIVRGPGILPNTTTTGGGGGTTPFTMMGTHVDLIPTLLGLAGQDVIPSTMDGRNLASCWKTQNNNNNDDDSEDGNENGKDDPISPPLVVDGECPTNGSTSSSLLIEYPSLGNVFRYNHTIDTYNHSFLALRLYQVHPEEKDEASSIPHYWFYSYDYENSMTMRKTSTMKVVTDSRSLQQVQQQQQQQDKQEQQQQDKQEQQHRPTQSFLLRTMKYVQYRDSRMDWNITNYTICLEEELFDLEQDPYEEYNIIDSICPQLLDLLQDKIQRLSQCYGDICRQEQNSGIPNTNIIMMNDDDTTRNSKNTEATSTTRREERTTNEELLLPQ